MPKLDTIFKKKIGGVEAGESSKSDVSVSECNTSSDLDSSRRRNSITRKRYRYRNEEENELSQNVTPEISLHKPESWKSSNSKNVDFIIQHLSFKTLTR